MLFMWKVERRQNRYRFQTSFTDVAARLRKIKGMRSVGWGMNSGDEIFEIELPDIETAKVLLRNVSDSRIYRFRDGFKANGQLKLKL